MIGRGDAVAMLADRPVSVLWGVGRALQGRLLADGIRTVGDVAHLDEMTLTARYGSIGRRLWRFSHGEDDRTVQPDQPAKSISAETTFQRDLSDRGRWNMRCSRCATAWPNGWCARAWRAGPWC